VDNSYLWLKSIHLFGVILFLGNIIVTGWWKNMADLTRNPQIVAFAQKQVTVTDWIFTAGGVVILLAAGMINVAIHGLSYSSKWLGWGMLLFVLAGIIWAVILIPTQIKQAKMAEVFAETGDITDGYWSLCKRWNIWGAIAVILPLINIYWMTFKPVA
jgi:uncharacterized membrane protein